MKQSAWGRMLGALTDQVMSAGSVFLANAVLARTQPAAEYGAFVLAYSVYSFLSGVHNGLLLEAFTVYGSGRFRDSFSIYWRFAFRANIFVVASLAMFLGTAVGVLALCSSANDVVDYVALVVVVPVLLTSLFVRRVLYVENLALDAGVMAVIYFGAVAAMLWVVVRVGALTGPIALLILAGSWLLAAPLFFYGRCKGLMVTNFLVQHPGYFREHWHYSKWVLLTALIFQLTSQGYFWIVALLIDTSSVAELRAAWNLVQPLAIVFSSLSALILPRLARLQQSASGGVSGMGRILSLYGAAVITVAALFAVCIWIFGNRAYSLIYAGRYDSSIGLLYVVALVPIITGIAGVFSDALRAMEKPRLIFNAYLVGSVLTLVVGVPVVVQFGIQGAAWTMVASNAGYAFMLVIFFVWLRGRRFRAAL